MAAADHNADTNPNSVSTPGRTLAFARERMSLSLEEIARRTKIGLPYLLAIENDDVDKLPGHFYARGFLRAYAREVHCDADDIVKRFGIAAEEEVELKDLDESLHLPAPVDLDDRRVARRLQMLALAVLVSGGFYVASGRPLRLTPARHAATTAVMPVHADIAAVSPPTPIATSGQTPAPPKPSPPAAPLTIEVHSTHECWLTATADSERVIYRLLSAGENAHIEAREEIVLRVGDAAAISFAINGTAGKMLGTSGEAVTIRVTPNNYREYLTSGPTERAGAGAL